MKKFLLSLVAVFAALSMNAATALTGSFSAWGETCTVADNVISYSESWAGAGYWLASTDENDNYVGYNMSDADYIWVTFAKGGTASVNMVIQYGQACAAGASGTSSTSGDAGDIIIGAKLDPAQKSDVSQFFLQCTQTVGSVTVTGVYAGTAEEFEAAKKQGPVSSSVLWEGEKTFDSTWPSIQISADKFASMKAGDKIKVTVSKADNSINTGWEWGPQVFINGDWSTVFSAVSVADGATDESLEFVLTDAEIAKIQAVSELEIQGMNVIVSKVEIEVGEALPEWEATGKAIAFSENGEIHASEFNGYTDDAKVEFVFSCSDATNFQNWGAGSVSSIDGTTVTALDYNKFGIKDITTTVSCTLADLKEALNTKSEWGTYGLYWNIWGFTDCTNERVSCTIYELVGATGEKFEAKADETAIYVIGDVLKADGTSNDWDFSNGDITIAFNSELNQYVGVITVADSWDGNGWIALSPILGTADEKAANDWTNFNQYRYSVSSNYGTTGETATLVQGVDQSFQLAAGTYTLYVDLSNMTIRIDAGDTGISSVSSSKANAAMYNTLGQRVNSAKGIVIKGGKKYFVK